MSLLDIIGKRRIFFVTGKGGTGKSTYTVAIGRLASEHYKTLVLDFDNKRSTLREILRASSLSAEPQRVGENLYFSHIEPDEALRYYLKDFIRSDFLINISLNLKPLKSFYNALPSAKEMLVCYFLLHLVKDFDFEKIFIDMPASGHAELFFKIPIAAKGIFNKGPVIAVVNEMNKHLYSRDRSCVIQIALPDEVVISETVEFYERFKAIEYIDVQAIVVNKRYRVAYTGGICEGLEKEEELIRLYNYYARKSQEEGDLISDLRKRTGVSIFEVPFFPVRAPVDNIVSFLKDL